MGVVIWFINLHFNGGQLVQALNNRIMNIDKILIPKLHIVDNGCVIHV